MNNKIYTLVAVLIVILGLFLFIARNNQTKNSSLPTTSKYPAENQVESNTVTIKGSTFSPKTIKIKVGDTVTWVNDNQVPHNIQSDSFYSPKLNQGDKYQYTFATAGTFYYICGIHPNMKGIVVVE
ncbi:cupredoxin family copper-binding protein [Candidatus Shapirobacteria bacterium]|nr:cupredoxin family copper-binding protein [Candidatus Shapirobacteria bacterium]